MKAAQYLRVAVLGAAMLCAGGVLAESPPPSTDSTQGREQTRAMSAEERAVYRDPMQERMRSLAPEERRLMGEPRTDASPRPESRQDEVMRQRSRDVGAQRSGYGQGYEARRGGGIGGGGMGGGGRGR